jgi:hypothetical protein
MAERLQPDDKFVKSAADGISPVVRIMGLARSLVHAGRLSVFTDEVNHCGWHHATLKIKQAAREGGPA